MDKKQPMEQNNSQIKDAVFVGQTFLKQYDNSDSLNQCWHLYDALLQLTANQLEQGIDAKECRFEYLELYKHISENNDGYKPSDDPQKKIRSLYNSLEKKLSETPNAHISKQLNLNIRPRLKKHSQAGRGHKASLWIAAESLVDEDEKGPLTELEGASSKEHQPKQRIKYYLEKTPKLPLWSRWAENIELQGWRKAALAMYVVLPGILLIIFALSLILFPFFQTPILVYISLYSIAALIIYYLFFGSLLKVFKNNIAIVPDMMLPLRLHSAVFELNIDKNPSRLGQRIKKLNIKVYSAKCPICESKVHLRKGGIAQWGRIIGECDLNPVEHIYSFDHTNLRGKNIR
jgi:hypothetical protein